MPDISIITESEFDEVCKLINDLVKGPVSITNQDICLCQNKLANLINKIKKDTYNNTVDDCSKRMVIFKQY